MRSRCSNVEMMSSPPGPLRLQIDRRLTGKVGQTSSAFDAAVPDLQSSRRLRWLGHVKRICRHLWHTCDNACHGHIPSYRSNSRRLKSNIYRRTSSGRTSIVKRPTLHQPVIVVVTISGSGTYVNLVPRLNSSCHYTFLSLGGLPSQKPTARRMCQESYLW